jgi:hypothetical protein
LIVLVIDLWDIIQNKKYAVKRRAVLTEILSTEEVYVKMLNLVINVCIASFPSCLFLLIGFHYPFESCENCEWRRNCDNLFLYWKYLQNQFRIFKSTERTINFVWWADVDWGYFHIYGIVISSSFLSLHYICYVVLIFRPPFSNPTVPIVITMTLRWQPRSDYRKLIYNGRQISMYIFLSFIYSVNYLLMFKKFQNTNPMKLSLNMLLITPVQRIPRYSLLLSVCDNLLYYIIWICYSFHLIL